MVFRGLKPSPWLDISIKGTGTTWHCYWPISENHLELADDSLSAAGTATRGLARHRPTEEGCGAGSAPGSAAGCEEARGEAAEDLLSQLHEAPGQLRPRPLGVTLADSFHLSLPARGLPRTGAGQVPGPALGSQTCDGSQ